MYIVLTSQIPPSKFWIIRFLQIYPRTIDNRFFKQLLFRSTNCFRIAYCSSILNVLFITQYFPQQCQCPRKIDQYFLYFFFNSKRMKIWMKTDGILIIVVFSILRQLDKFIYRVRLCVCACVCVERKNKNFIVTNHRDEFCTLLTDQWVFISTLVVEVKIVLVIKVLKKSFAR